MNTGKALASLISDYHMTVRDPMYKDIYISENIRRIYLCREVQKLAHIKQLGPTHLVYPGAVHTRLNHSLGVYHVSRTILISLLNRISRYGFEHCLTEEGLQDFMIAALLHDIGHFPYAHSLKQLPLKEHEFIATEMIRGDEELNRAIRESGANVDRICSIIGDDTLNDDETLFYRAMLSGTLDPDKLDYLNRDAFFCGVPYGMQDSGYISTHIGIFDNRPVFDASAYGMIEHLIFSKYLMYKHVYWHKYVRSATAMIKKALVSGLENGVITADDLYGIDDRQFSTFPRRFSWPSFRLIDMVDQNRLFYEHVSVPFDENIKLHRDCIDLAKRTENEMKLYHELRKHCPDLQEWEIIIDIPEPISFESDIMLFDENHDLVRFDEYDNMFRNNMGSNLAKNLRQFRIFAPERLDTRLIEKALEEIDA